MALPTDRTAGPSRRRLVIALGRGPLVPHRSGPAAPRWSRAGKVLVILGIGVFAVPLCAAGGGFLWWHHDKTTPAYSLALLVDAAQRNDMAAVDKVVDTDMIVDDLAAQVAEQAAGRYGSALGASVRKQIESLVPSLLPAMKQGVRDSLAARVKEISEKWGHQPLVVVVVALPYFVNITMNGDTAKATAVFHDQRVECDMQRNGDGWKVVAVRDGILVQRVVDEVMQDLPAIGQADEQGLRKSLKQPPRNLPQFRIP